MHFTKEGLKDVFKKAKESNSSYVFVCIEAEEVQELIVIPKRSFRAKENFYIAAYDDNLTHVMNKNVLITGLSYGNADQLKEFI